MKRHFYERHAFLFASTLLGIIFYVFILGDSGYLKLRSLRQQSQKLDQELNILAKQNAFLYQEYYSSVKHPTTNKKYSSKSPDILFKYQVEKNINNKITDFLTIPVERYSLQYIRVMYIAFLSCAIVFIYALVRYKKL